ncbi:DUF1700 domain-containing protein [Paenibacillus sp. CAU 1782]
MSPLGKAYLDKLYQALKMMPEEERIDAVREIESHIIEGILGGQPEAAILARLGDPRKLAKAYRSEYLSQNASFSFKHTFGLIGFYCTTGLLSIMIVPVLATIAYGFGFCTVLILLGSFIRTFGVTWISMEIGSYVVPTQLSLIYGVVVGGIVGGIAFVCWKMLKRYLSYVTGRHRRILDAEIRS